MNWVFGDVHGCAKTLVDLITKIQRDYLMTSCIFTGDILNRGTAACETVGIIENLQRTKGLDKTAVVVRGNHDDVLCYLLDIPHYSDFSNFISKPITKRSIIRWFMNHGLNTTFADYANGLHALGLVTHKDFGSIEHVLEVFEYLGPLKKPAYDHDINTVLGMSQPYYHEKNFSVFHGWYPLDESVLYIHKPSKYQEFLWNSFKEHELEKCEKHDTAWEKDHQVIVGHTPVFCYPKYARTNVEGVYVPIVAGNLVLIDTGCGKNDPKSSLSAYCPDPKISITVPVNPKDFE